MYGGVGGEGGQPLPLSRLSALPARLEDDQKVFNQVELAAPITHEYAMPYESNLPVYVCRKPKMSLKDVWPLSKNTI